MDVDHILAIFSFFKIPHMSTFTLYTLNSVWDKYIGYTDWKNVHAQIM